MCRATNLYPCLVSDNASEFYSEHKIDKIESVYTYIEYENDDKFLQVEMAKDLSTIVPCSYMRGIYERLTLYKEVSNPTNRTGKTVVVKLGGDKDRQSVALDELLSADFSMSQKNLA